MADHVAVLEIVDDQRVIFFGDRFKRVIGLEKGGHLRHPVIMLPPLGPLLEGQVLGEMALLPRERIAPASGKPASDVGELFRPSQTQLG